MSLLSLKEIERRDLGLRRVRALSNNPLKLRALEEGGLEIVERVALDVDAPNDALRYLSTKKHRMGHLIELPAA